MKTAVSLHGDNESDIRDAARIAARRDGLSLGDWLDNVMTKRAKSLGLDLSDLSPDQRIHAVIKDLGWAEDARVASEASRRGQGGPPGGQDPAAAGSAPADETPGQGGVRDIPAATPAAAPVAVSGAREPGFDPDRSMSSASRQAAQRVQIETKLNALFKALDKPARRPDAGATVIEAPQPPAEDVRLQSLLGETAISPTWRLEKAVSEIAERQAFLDRQAAAEASLQASRPRRRHDDVREPGEAELLAKAGPGDALERPDAVRSRRPAEPVPSIFTSLQGDINRLAQRLDAVDLDAAHRPSPSRGSSFDEIRALLDEMRPNASIDTLGKHVEALSSKLDKVIDHQAPTEAINKLSQRIEDVHAEVEARLSAEAATPAVDMDAIERMVRDVVARSAPDRSELRGLEDAVVELAGRLERAESLQVDGAALADLQAKVETLASRIDRSEAGMSAIVAMERSLGDLFSRMGEIRDETAHTADAVARSAARETVDAALAAMPQPPAMLGFEADESVAQVSRDLAEFRAGREEADKRLHAILAALNTSLERVVDRLGALEDDVADGRGAPVATTLAPALRNRPDVAAEAPPVPPAANGAAQPLQPSPRQAPPATPHATPVDLDVPIEPGSGPLRPRPDMAVADAPAVMPDPTSFIAAARRAAQIAAQEQASRSDAGAKARSRNAAATGVVAPGKVKGVLASRRRPLLLALAGLVLLIGAAQIVRLSLGSGREDAAQPETAAADTKAQVAAVAAAPVKPEDTSPALTAKIETAPAAEPAPAAAVPDAAPARALPTLAMGPAANLAAAQLAENAGKGAAAGGTLPSALRDMAQDGRADAQYEVALRYADGRGVARDLKTAAGWFEKAAKQGLAPAAYRLGSLYERGLGVTRDAAQSIAWYQKAADAGNVRAMHNLAVLLAEGATGKADYPAAASWFTKAAEAGVRDSQFNLAILYARGLGLDQNLSQSYTWFTIAAAQGDADSAKKRDDIAPRLDAATLAAAKKAAETFKPTLPLAAANEVPVPPGGWDALPAVHAPGLKGAAPAHVSSM